MKYFYSLLAVLFSILAFFFTNHTPRHHPRIEQENKWNSNAVVEWAKNNLPQNGILKEDPDGFVYLKVDDGYINQLFPQLHVRNYVKPPFFRRPDAPGAHISVIYVEELRRIGKIKEIGSSYTFTIKSLAFVPPQTGEFIILQVESPELDNLRSSYGLSPHLKGHQFHISIAKRRFRR
ncbi:MAG: hypothetical protein H0W88_00925 [Parachlamydiaceae bacterium]|nr:hypothetical protein [Parachlamydiaceae bacterium]